MKRDVDAARQAVGRTVYGRKMRGTETVLDQLGSRSVRWVYGRAWMNNRQIDVQQKMNDDDDDDDDNDDDNSDDKNDKIREGERVGNREMAWHEKGARHAKLNLA